MARCGQEGSAQEVLAEVYVQVWRKAKSFDPARGSAWTWLVSIARNRAIDRLRSEGGRLAGPQDSGHEFEPQDPSPTPVEYALGNEGRERLRSAVFELPDEQREVLEASFLASCSHSEVALRLGLPLGTVKSRIRAGLERLRQSMLKPGVDGAAWTPINK